MLLQAWNLMMQGNNLGDPNFDFDSDENEDWENEATKVEIGNNYVIVAKELENGDPFYVVFSDKPLHRCETTFTNGWGNTWYEGDMILGGIWYKCLPSQTRRCPSYILLKDDPSTFTYSHLVLRSKFPMLPTTTRKGVSRFTMHDDV
jgi:hypothetical protein